jgi:hypothetical protein
MSTTDVLTAAPEPTPEGAPTSASGIPHDEPGSHPDYAPALADATFWQYWPMRLLVLTIAIASCMIDVPLVRPVFNVVAHLDDILATLVSAGLMTVAGLVATTVGALHRADQSHPKRRGHRTAVLLAAGGWLCVGVVLTVIRWIGADDAVVASLLEGGALDTSERETERGLAIAMLGLYIATGIACYAAGHALNPTVQSMISNTTRLRRLDRQFAKLLGTLTHLDGIRVSKYRDVEAESTSFWMARLMDSGAADLLHAHTRKRIAIALGDPAATGATGIRPTTKHRDQPRPITLPAGTEPDSGE